MKIKKSLYKIGFDITDNDYILNSLVNIKTRQRNIKALLVKLNTEILQLNLCRFTLFDLICDKNFFVCTNLTLN